MSRPEAPRSVVQDAGCVKQRSHAGVHLTLWIDAGPHHLYTASTLYSGCAIDTETLVIPIPPLHWQTISELSRHIHSGALSPVDLMEHLLTRVEALDSKLHSFRLVHRERALAAAQAAALALRAGQDAGPLHGIPYAVKDLIDIQGLPTTAGSNLLLDNIATSDATVVRRLNQAGMVLLGKAQTVQFAFGAPGINHHHGTPHNPWHAIAHVPPFGAVFTAEIGFFIIIH